MLSYNKWLTSFLNKTLKTKQPTQCGISGKCHLVGRELDSDAMFVKSMLENHHVLCIAGVVLDHSDHLIVLEQLLQFLLQEEHQRSLLLSKKWEESKNPDLRRITDIKVNSQSYGHFLTAPVGM